MLLEGKKIVVTGGTGSLGKRLVCRLLRGELGLPSQVVVFSRDEAKQHAMRLESQRWGDVTEEIIYRDGGNCLQFVLGDIRDINAVMSAFQETDFVVHAAAMKQVPTCEYNPTEAVKTNILGSMNVVQAIRDNGKSVDAVVGISTDKAVEPVNTYGMSKAIQESIFTVANFKSSARFSSVRYGNVLSSRGSVVPLFQEQIKRGGPVTITTPQMTRFLFTLNQAVDVVFMSLQSACAGEIIVPRISSVCIESLAQMLIGGREIKIESVGIRPGEKIHESLISEEEKGRVELRDGYYVIRPRLPELQTRSFTPIEFPNGYSSSNCLMNFSNLHQFLKENNLLPEEGVTQ